MKVQSLRAFDRKGSQKSKEYKNTEEKKEKGVDARLRGGKVPSESVHTKMWGGISKTERMGWK